MAAQRRATGRKRREEGAGLVEYVLLISLIMFVCVISVAFLGDNVMWNFDSAGSSIHPGP